MRFTRLYLLVMASVWFAGSAGSTSGQELRDRLLDCARIQDDGERLDCFDGLAGSLQASSEVAESGWKMNAKSDPIDDTETLTLYLAAANTTPEVEKPVYLFIRCRSGETSSFITWNRELAGAETLVRFDQAEAERQYWNLSTDSEATFQPGDGEAFVKRLMETRVLTVQVNPVDSRPLTAVFDLAGLEDAVDPLRESCGW